MNSTSAKPGELRQAMAWFRKEVRTELRAKHGLLVSALFGLMAVAAMSFVAMTERPSPLLGGGMMTVVLLFAGISAVPRLFLVEEDQGTLSLARTLAPPVAIYLGKLMFALVQQLITGLLLSVLFVVLAQLSVRDWPLLLTASALISVALAAALCSTSALVIGATNRWLVASVAGLPLLYPLVFLGFSVLRVALGQDSLEGGWRVVIALAAYAAAAMALGPGLVRLVWNERKDPPQAIQGPQS